MFRSLAVACIAMALAVSASAAPAQAKKASSKAAAARSVTGTLDRYDSSGNSIVINTGKTTETLVLSSDSAIRMGAQRMTPADLTAHAGQKVKVRYSESNGQKTVSSVQIEGGTSKTARASTAKPPAKK
jgi:hypothetical protein